MYKRIFVFLAIFLLGIFLGGFIAQKKFAADLLRGGFTVHKKFAADSQVGWLASYVKEANDPATTAFFEEMSKMTTVSVTPFFGICGSEDNDIYSIVTLKDKCVIVSELYEHDPDLGKEITRTYSFDEGDNHIVCAFSRDHVTKRLKRCYYSFDDGTVRRVCIDTNGDGIWDIDTDGDGIWDRVLKRSEDD